MKLNDEIVYMEDVIECNTLEGIEDAIDQNRKALFALEELMIREKREISQLIDKKEKLLRK